MALLHGCLTLLALTLTVVPAPAGAQTAHISPRALTLEGVAASVVTYQGRRATRLVEDDRAPHTSPDLSIAR